MSLFRGPLGKFTWRMLAVILGTESVIVFFGALVARGLGGRGADLFWPLCALAVAFVVGAGLIRRPFGLTLGWALQILVLISGLFVPMMFLAGLVFLLLWVVCLVQGRRIDAEVAAREREAAGGADPDPR
ncbi:DUF4233 domain-containing protein [Kribbia dieselivorans]|uniref:DUF4233 domain-containing protein n=1 Tax=Kribbia dieselivorans TaxID=331526 RepID=UPI0008389989|nr:DUF4233 domain-containing protein [Kribbia dieselivorans]